MTIYTLKETLHDRIGMLEAACDSPHPKGYERGMLEGRLEEARVMFRLVDQVATDQVTLKRERRDRPLLFISADEIEPEDFDRYDPNRC